MNQDGVWMESSLKKLMLKLTSAPTVVGVEAMTKDYLFGRVGGWGWGLVAKSWCRVPRITLWSTTWCFGAHPSIFCPAQCFGRGPTRPFWVNIHFHINHNIVQCRHCCQLSLFIPFSSDIFLSMQNSVGLCKLQHVFVNLYPVLRKLGVSFTKEYVTISLTLLESVFTLLFGWS